MKDNFTHINNDLLVKYLLNETNLEEVVQVENWLAADESNRQYYEHFKLIWEESRLYKTPVSVNEDVAWKRFQQRIHTTSRQPVISQPATNFQWMRMAAIFVLVIAGAWLAIRLMTDRPARTIVSQTKGSRQIDTLPDGSVITLNKNSLIKYPEKFTEGSRKISMEGEAFFNISPNKNKPFIIQVNDVSVRVVGTSFNIKSVNGNTEVIVETGIVQVIRKNHSIRLEPEEKITVRRQDSILVKQPVTDRLYNFYRTKKFSCDSTPLWKLVQVLNEEYNVNIVIGRKDLRTLPLTTEFNDESLDKILSVISETFNISVTHAGDQIILQ